MYTKTLLATALFALSALAEQQLTNECGSECGTIQTDDKLCVPQGEGAWTFSMNSGLTIKPGPGKFRRRQTSNWVHPDQSDATFRIYDNTCKIMGSYTQGSQGIPFTIQENFLKQTLIIDSMDSGVGSGYFSFRYGAGKYSIRNNQCGCVSEGSGLNAYEKCKCAFPIAGDGK